MDAEMMIARLQVFSSLIFEHAIAKCFMFSSAFEVGGVDGVP